MNSSKLEVDGVKTPSAERHCRRAAVRNEPVLSGL